MVAVWLGLRMAKMRHMRMGVVGQAIQARTVSSLRTRSGFSRLLPMECIIVFGRVPWDEHLHELSSIF